MTSEKDQGIDDVSIDCNPFDILGQSPRGRLSPLML